MPATMGKRMEREAEAVHPVSPILVLSTTYSATWGTSCWGCSSC